MSRTELRFGLVRAAVFGAVAATLPFVTTSERSPSIAVIALLVVGYAIAWNVMFETPAGSVVPIALALIPMLFLLPVAWVPLLAGLAAGLPELRRAPRLRGILGSVGFTWPVLAPTLVLLLAGEPAASWTAWPVYLAAWASYLILNLATIALHLKVVTGSAARSVRPVIMGIRFDLVFAPVAFLGVIASPSAPFAFMIPFCLFPLARLLTAERTRNQDKSVELSHAYRGTALLLGTVIDADDGYTGLHSRGVVDLAMHVGLELRLGADELQRTEFAALLHDVGKIRIPKEIINKPGPLTPDEWNVVRRHPGEGAEMLTRVGGFLADIGEIVRHHHERWDGTGYPDGLAGEAIPLIARIVAVCDAFSAITTDRAYRKGRPAEIALAELRNSAGSQFDTRVVEALVTVIARDDGIVPSGESIAA